MQRFATVAACLALAGLGFGAGAVLLYALPFDVPGTVLVALACCMFLGVPEMLFMRRFSKSGWALFRLDGEPFPFLSLGLAAAILVFGSP